MKNKIFTLLTLLVGAALLVACSKTGDAEKVYTFKFWSAWPVYVLALLCAIAAVPADDKSDKAGLRVISALVGRLAQLGGWVLIVAGFWRWDAHWALTLCVLLTFGAIANSTSNASNKGLGAVVQFICAIAAVAACVFSYIQLW